MIQRLALSVFCLCALLSVPSAQAGVALGVDGGVALADGQALPLLGGRLGWHVKAAKIIHFTPELGVRKIGDGLVGFGGARLGINALAIMPSVYAHAGAGLSGLSGTYTDLGAALDLTAIPKFRVGLHGGANQVGDLFYLDLGGHVELAF